MDGITRKVTQPVKTFTQKYEKDVLHLGELPCLILRKLERDVKEHLKEINKLISWYEEDNYIKRLISKNQFPTNHEEAIRHDFYKRCINEQKIILSHYLHNIKDRAIQKSYYFPFIKRAFAFTDRFHDYPYDFSYNFSRPQFDYRLINEVGHRIPENYGSDNLRDGLYEKNKTNFYKKLLKVHSPKQIFNDINFHLNHIPLANDRKPIFNELERLFKGKRWMSFFALALPQVEGLFTEMVEVVYPGGSAKSLSDKVQKVRPFHSLSTVYFDYYQYIVPRLRNKFMHKGYDENFILKAYDLLTDLNHILRVFYELENPVVKIRKYIIHSSMLPLPLLAILSFETFIS